MSNLSEFGPCRGRRGVQRDRIHEDGVSTRQRCHIGPRLETAMLRAGADPDQRALDEINSFDGPLLIADIVSKIKNIRDFAGKKKRGLAKLDPQNYDDMGPLIEVRSPRFELACVVSTRAWFRTES